MLVATVYVQRTGAVITGVYALRQSGYAEEAIDEAHADVVTFRAGRRPRKLRAIVADLDALTPANKLAIWNAINAGSPPKWTASDQGEVWACLRLSELSSDPLRTQMRLTAVALYCRNEDPRFLVNPVFAPGLNLPGDEPAL